MSIMTSIQLPGNASPFLHRCNNLFEKLVTKISTNQKNERNAQLRIQYNFEIATNYNIELNAMVENYQFVNELEEIFFFKQIKPAFTAEIEFQSFCYHAELFKSTVEDNDPLETELFYRRQLQRMDRFRREHPKFFEYVSENRNDKDSLWFTRSENIAISESERRCTSPYDKQMGIYLALKRYMIFIELKLKELQHQ